MTNAEILGDELRNFRIEVTELDQGQVAEICNLSRQQVSSIECGRNLPRMTTLAELGRGLGISLAEIITFMTTWHEGWPDAKKSYSPRR